MGAKEVLELHRDRLFQQPGGAMVYAEMAKVSSGGMVPVYDAATVALRCATAVHNDRQARALARLRADLQDCED